MKIENISDYELWRELSHRMNERWVYNYTSSINNKKCVASDKLSNIIYMQKESYIYDVDLVEKIGK